jgi:hypothetical protein
MLILLVNLFLNTAGGSQGTLQDFKLSTCNPSGTSCLEIRTEKASRSLFKALFAFRNAEVSFYKRSGDRMELSSHRKNVRGYFDSQLNIAVLDKNDDREVIDLSRF